MIELFVRSARAHRARYLLTSLAIVFATAFVVVSFELGRYGRDAITNSTSTDYGRATAVVTTASPDPNRDITKEVADVDSVGYAYGQSSHTARVRRGAKAVDFLAFNVPDPAFGFANLLTGEMPVRAEDIAITQTLAASLDLKVGDAITVGVKYRSANHPEEQSFSIPMVVSGIYESLGPNLARGESATGYVANATSRQWSIREGKSPNAAVSKVYVTTAPGASDAQMLSEIAAIPNVVVQSRTSMAHDRTAQLLESATIMETTTSVLGLFIIVLASVVIWNTFQVITIAHRRSLATLRCIGASSHQIWGLIVGEAFVLGMISSGLGVGIGMVLAKFIPTIVHSSDEAWEIPASIAIHPSFAFIAFAAGLAVTLGSSLPAGYYATRVAPLAALRSEYPTGSHAKNLDRRLLPGLVMLGIGFTSMVYGTRMAHVNLSIEPGVWSIGVGAVIMVGGAVTLSPLLPSVTAAPLANAIRALTPRSKRVSVEFAIENIRQSPRRSGTTISALFITTCLLTGASVTATSARQTLLTNLEATYSHDIDIHQALSPSGVGLGISPEQKAAAASSPDVAGVLPIYETKIKTSVGGFESTVVEAFDPSLAKDVVSPHSGPHRLVDGVLLLPKNASHRVDTASIVGNNGRSIRLAVEYVRVVRPTMSLNDLRTISGVGEPTTLWLSVKGSMTTNTGLVTAVATNVNAVSGSNPPVVTSWMLRQHTAYESAIVRVTGILVVHLIIATLVAATGVTSTITLALVERRRETMVLRALGLTRRDLRRSLTNEQLVLGGVGTIFGTAFGIGGAALVAQSLFAGIETGVFLQIPWISISVVILLELAATAVLTFASTRTSVHRWSLSLRDGKFSRL